MPTTVAELNAVVERLWPPDGTASWDAPGLLSGDPHAIVRHIHLAVDAVVETVDEAVGAGAQALLVHHPLLLRGVTALPESTAKGAAIARLIRGGVALIAAHTNADVVASGTSAILAERIGLRDAEPIEPIARDGGLGIGRVGELAEATTLGHLAQRLAEILPPTATGIRGAGEWDAPVRRVAVCAGAGDSLLGHPLVQGADVYITSDLRHHPASEARELGRIAERLMLLDTSHWAAEWLWLEVAAAELRAELPELDVTVSELRTDPWDFAVTQ
ncbi:Nif3-like dinuclear metal center hexameric protein [Homoserinibacter sp. YIM 151385]|uniref:Nif3-like dinuclear metal center hexameric protein n=1 Tax=Homoserinibacter sp. YIM 151385 TaxID=2985506 RepID=UPI0022F08F30|nr:Nif3-like dinuclear metal center hexameric protein [Homoserinibacter sp. YIM 151385]WBU38463.1 Nif3-like dinuclear metal center hexameric protein [Homoserinibacter sp. YIM 151385]